MTRSEGFFAWFAVIVYAGAIFIFSSVPGDYLVQPIFKYDKVLHFIEYIPLGFLMFGALRKSTRASIKSCLFFSIMITCLYALTDEIHQLFVPGRQFSYYDFGVDSLGAVAGNLLRLWQK